MNPGEPKQSKPLRWLLILSVIGLMIIVGAGYLLYPRYQARQWEEEMLVTANIDEAQAVVWESIHAENPYADAVLTRHANRLDNVVFAKEHRVVLMLNEKTGQPYSAARWTRDNLSPNITARFVRPRIVENLPEAVTIAVTNEVNGLTCLFFYTYKRTVYACDLSAEELKQFEQNGYWYEYVTREGDPIADRRQKRWNTFEEESYQHWRQQMEQAFKDANVMDQRESSAEAGKQQDSDEEVGANSGGNLWPPFTSTQTEDGRLWNTVRSHS